MLTQFYGVTRPQWVNIFSKKGYNDVFCWYLQSQACESRTRDPRQSLQTSQKVVHLGKPRCLLRPSPPATPLTTKVQLILEIWRYCTNQLIMAYHSVCCYKKVNFLTNRHPIAHPWGQGMGNLFGFKLLYPCSNEVRKGVYWNEIVRLSVHLSICRHNPVTALLRAIFLQSRPNLVGTYHGWKSWPSSFMGDVAC